MTLAISDEGVCRTLVLDRPQAANALSADRVDRLTDDGGDHSQVDLIRSAAASASASGLKQRMVAYRRAQLKARNRPPT
ncbi:hypothetical protein O4H66_00910 [Comamonadaceae bacterium G21597-S1]|nr:hypothetical protein [Comamonadaceae bacterium G21597-S1]